MGSAFYMSPEQLTDPKGVDRRSDIWSLGVILYQLLAGPQPFLGETVPRDHRRHPLEPAREHPHLCAPRSPFGLEVVIGKCMQNKPVRPLPERRLSSPPRSGRSRTFVIARASTSPRACSASRSSRPRHPRREHGTPARRRCLTPSSPNPNAQTGPTLPPFADAASSSTSASQVDLQSPAVASTTAMATPGKEPAAAPAVPAVTTHAMATSAISEKPKRSPTPMIAAGVVLFARGSGAASSR